MSEEEAKVKWNEDFLNLKSIALSILIRENKTFYIAIDLNSVFECQRETLKKIVVLLKKLIHQDGVFIYLYNKVQSNEWVDWFDKLGIEFNKIVLTNDKPYYDFLIDYNAGFKEVYWHYLYDLLPLVIGFIKGQYTFNDMIPKAKLLINKIEKQVRIEDIDISTYLNKNIKITNSDLEEV